TIPVAPAKARFRRTDVSDREKIALAHALGWPEDLVETLKPRERTAFRPVMPLKKGHVAMLMASGLMGTMRLEKNGRRLLVKGRVIKHTDRSTEADEKSGEEITVLRERFVTTVGIVSSDGVRIVDDVEGLTDFMEEHGDEIAGEILKNPPLYDLKPTPQEWGMVDNLGRNREPLPGQKEPGLLDVQKHAAVALARACRAHGSALIQGEMGLGKTTIALAAIDLLGAYPALIMCPPHLVPKWLREAKEVIPGVQVRELKRIGRNGGQGEVNDVRRFIEDWRNGLLGSKAIAVVASTSAKLGSGWKGAVTTRHTLPREPGRRIPFREALERYKEARSTLRSLVELGADPEIVEEQRRKARRARRQALSAAVPYPVCPACGQVQVERKKGAEEPILDFRAFDRRARICTLAASGWTRNKDGERVWADGDNGDAPTCSNPLYTFGADHRRWPIADYIAAKARGFFKMLVADEVHQYKGKASDRGLAFHRLVNATKYQLALTGTFYGGKATSIFWLMHRLRMGNTHRDFAYNDERRWVQQYGILETRISNNKKKDDADGFGAFNATKRRRVYTQEKPGVSPAILHRIIGNSVFLSLADLGVALPPYSEEVAIVKMAPAQAEQYRRMESLLRAKARDDNRYLSTWLQWSLNRPDSAFRDEAVKKVFTDDDGNVVKVERLLDLPAVVNGALLPKEEFLDFARSEVAAGRKVLVYVRQTGTRDIQPRLRNILRQAGLQAEILSSTVATRKREAWIEKNGHRVDVLIVNPRLVETGLDLVQFATVVFYEIDYSLYTVWQAMRRVWRLGQSKPVKIVFVGYAETLEEKALALMGRKMKAAQLLYGDEVGGAIVPEEDGDFLTELARTVLEGQELPDLKALFAAVKQETQSPLGSPTAQSPRLPVYTEEQLRALWLAEVEARAARRRRRRRVPEGQMRLL
ncbi:MAG TPA: hypothetical protein EYH32_03945, partial [Anaerolineae bacterium]|nr:hypothetical protein [Anaerolineae bacterium]